MLDNRELISVVIPIYNGEYYVTDMLKMLRAQSYQNLEIILVNDGSTDNTLEALKKEIGEDSRFLILDKENTGPSDSRNMGLAHCRGVYVAFIDADDYIFPEYLQYLYELLKKHDAEIACCNYRKVKGREEIPVYKIKADEYVYSNVEALGNLYRKEKITGYPYLKLFKRSILENLEFPRNITYAEDIVFVDAAIKKSNKVVYGDKILYIYFQNEKSITHSIDAVGLKKAWQYNLEYFEKDGVARYPELEKAIYCKQFVMAMDLASRVCKIDKSFYRELLLYIRKAAPVVAKDKENTTLQHILGRFARVSARGTVKLCVLFNFLKDKMGFQMQKAV